MNRQEAGTAARQTNPKRSVTVAYLTLNAAVYACWMSLLLVVKYASDQKTRVVAHITEMFFAASVAIVSAIVFYVSGKWVGMKFKALAIGSFVVLKGPHPTRSLLHTHTLSLPLPSSSCYD